MLAPTLLRADFLAAFQRLLPRGLVWPRDPDSVQTQAIAALMPTYERSAARANYLLVDAFPATTIELLPEWELTLGLPDPCQGLSPTIQQRAAQVRARFAARGGQSAAYFIQYAATLGYAITITQFTFSHFGSAFGMPFNGVAWAHAWQVNAPQITQQFFKFGADAFGDPFSFIDNTVLICELQRLAPAQTTLLFSFTNLQPFNQTDWPNPRGPVPAISLRTWIDDLKQHLIGVDNLPRRAPDQQNPRGATSPISLRDWSQRKF